MARIGGSEELIECLNQGREAPTLLGGQENASMLRIEAGKRDEISDVEGEDAATLGSCPEELLVVAGLSANPVARSASDVMPPIEKGLMKRLA